MDQYRLDISKFSTLARGTGTKNGVIVGEGIETIGDHLSVSYPGIELEKPKTAPLPSTYLTRRGSLMLYSHPDISPSWEQDLLGCYNNMGSLIDGIESIASKKEEKVKSMDPRCVPGRHFNGYVGVLKNSLFFPRKGRSPGLELLPMHLEDMGVNIGEFLRGKGCYDHLIPPEQMSLYLPHVDIMTEEYQPEEVETSTAEGTAQPTAQPTPAPPQSPLPDDTNQNQRVTRIGSYSAGRRFVSSGARRTGSARSAGLASETDSAYGTKFVAMNRNRLRPFLPSKRRRFTNKLPPIAMRPKKPSADMSTYRSAISTPNRLDASLDRPPVDTNVTVTINNSGDRTKDQLGWVQDGAHFLQPSQRDEGDATEALDARVRLGDNNKLLARTRVAEWVNAADSISGLQPPSTPISHSEEAQGTDEAEARLGKQNSFFTTNDSTSSFTTEFDEQPEKKLDKKKAKRGTLSAVDSSSLGQVTVTSTFETGTLEQSSSSHMKSIDKGIDEKNSSRVSVTEDYEIKAFSLSELDGGNEGSEVESEDIAQDTTPKLLGVTFQPRYASADLKTPNGSEGHSSSQPTTTASSLLPETNRRNNRNASNVFGADWRTEEESPLISESLSESANVPRREGPSLFGFDQTSSDSPVKTTLRPPTSLSGTSGIETLPPSGMTSMLDIPVPVPPKPTVSLFESVSGRGDHELATRTPAPSVVTSTSPARPATATPTSPAKEAKKAARGKVAPRPPKKPKTGATRARRTVRAASAGAASRAKSAEERAAAAAAAAQERAERQERERAELAAKREAAAAAARAEKERRLATAALLQERIKSAEEQHLEQQKEMERRKRETEQRLKALVAEEETMRQMEEEARHQIMANRKEMRAEREKKRQEELEKRKEEIRRRREEDERRQEQATRREREMLARLGDPALQERMEADEALRRAERERLMMERLAEEERFAMEAAAAEEARLAEFERLAEEEAVARLREDMDEVEERRRTLMREQEELRREEEEMSFLMEPCVFRRRSLAQEAVLRRARVRRDLAKTQPDCGPVQRAVQLFIHLVWIAGGNRRWPPQGYYPKTYRQTPLTRLCRMATLAEQRRMEEEREAEAERQRQRQEEERQLQLKMPLTDPNDLELEEAELQKRLKAEAAQLEAEELKRRERNQEVRAHLASLQLNQHLTRPWTYSYFVHWPRDLFEKPMGGGAAKQKQFRFPPPKSAAKNKGALPPL